LNCLDDKSEALTCALRAERWLTHTCIHTNARTHAE